MKTEYEAKFVKINIESVRQKLRSLGGALEKPMRLMRRVTIDTPAMKARHGYLRVRDEGDRVTITYKQFDNSSIDGAKEYEVCVDNFEEAIAILDATGLTYTSFQESKRETWKLGDVEIVIDEWPWLSPYLEIEADSEQAVKATAKALGFLWNEALFGDVMVAYRAEYPHLTAEDTIASIKNVTFAEPLPTILSGSVMHNSTK